MSKKRGLGKSYRANRRQRVCPGSYIFDINHARCVGPNFIWNSAQPQFFTAELRNAAIFLKTLSPFRFNLSLSLPLPLSLSLFQSESFISRGSFANGCPKFDSGRNDVENVARLAKDISRSLPSPDENNKRVKPYWFNSILLRYDTPD